MKPQTRVRTATEVESDSVPGWLRLKEWTRGEVMESENAIVPGWPVEQFSFVILTGLENFVDFMVEPCLRLPSNIILLCFHFQRELLMLPFRCVDKVYHSLFVPPVSYLLRSFKSLFGGFIPEQIVTSHSPEQKVTSGSPKQKITPVELLTGERNSSPEKVIAACREIRCSTVKSISKNQSTGQLHAYKEQLEKWRLESQKKTEEIYKIGSEEKELMKAVASALRYLRLLKSKQEKVYSNFNQSMNHMVNTKTMSADTFKTFKKRVANIDADIADKKKVCLDLLSNGQLDDILDFVCNGPVKDYPMQNMRDYNPPPDMTQKVLNIATEENAFMRSQLTSTFNKLEDILKLSENINNEVKALNEKFTKVELFKSELSNLQYNLDRERKLLKAVEADRDIMKNKLETLEEMILEEEEFLGDSGFEAAFENSDCCIVTDLDDGAFSTD